jgi:hypothetical protein
VVIEHKYNLINVFRGEENKHFANEGIDDLGRME